jgi:hypothetical protein
MCGGEFTATNTIEESEQEYRELFNEEVDENNAASVCDDCFKKLMKDRC